MYSVATAVGVLNIYLQYDTDDVLTSKLGNHARLLSIIGAAAAVHGPGANFGGIISSYSLESSRH